MNRGRAIPFAVPFASSRRPCLRLRNAGFRRFHQMTDPVVQGRAGSVGRGGER